MMYIAAACLVLFDARGTLQDMGTVFWVTAAIQLALLTINYFPHILHRPQLVDALCADLIAFATNAAGICLLHKHPNLQYACVLHTVCFLVHHKYLGRCSTSSAVLLHTVMVLILVAAYFQGPRVYDLQQFVVSAVWPHVLEAVVAALLMMHTVAVMYVSEI